MGGFSALESETAEELCISHKGGSGGKNEVRKRGHPAVCSTTPVVPCAALPKVAGTPGDVVFILRVLRGTHGKLLVGPKIKKKKSDLACENLLFRACVKYLSQQGDPVTSRDLPPSI